MGRREWVLIETAITLFYISRSVSHQTLRMILLHFGFDRTEVAITDRLRLLRRTMPDLQRGYSWAQEAINEWINYHGLEWDNITNTQAMFIATSVLNNSQFQYQKKN
jgi:hypothetical protein